MGGGGGGGEARSQHRAGPRHANSNPAGQEGQAGGGWASGRADGREGEGTDQPQPAERRTGGQADGRTGGRTGRKGGWADGRTDGEARDGQCHQGLWPREEGTISHTGENPTNPGVHEQLLSRYRAMRGENVTHTVTARERKRRPRPRQKLTQHPYGPS